MIKFKLIKERECKHSQRYEEIEVVKNSSACKIIYLNKIALTKAFNKIPEKLLITIEEVVDTPF